MPSPSIKNVHFVGSICLPDTPTVFHTLNTTLPTQLKRIPDGEPGNRGNFVLWQRSVFSKHPCLLRSLYFSPPKCPGPIPIPPEEIQLLSVGYDDAAIDSYAIFRKLRGIIPKGVKFQVSLPTPINVLHVAVEPAYQEALEPIYTKALLKAVRRIQDEIPAGDLAIQWDVAVEFAFLEGIISPPPHWVMALRDSIVNCVVQLADSIDPAVELGFHFCYGDLGHQHFMQPRDMSLLVDIANRILVGTRRRRSVNWVHMPVPKDRIDREYFEPLRKLDRNDTELYLGLLHQDDLEGTKLRIKAASEFVEEFGIATECGLGRADAAELKSALAIAKEVTEQKDHFCIIGKSLINVMR